MSHENVAVVRAMFDAFNRGDASKAGREEKAGVSHNEQTPP